MTPPKSDEEYRQIVATLRQWFIAQDINPPDAGIAMTMLIAELLVEHTQDVTKLQESINANKEFLTVEIEGWRRRKQN